MKPAREPASSRPKPCASLKKPHESCPFAAPCGPPRKKKGRGQTPASPSEISRFAPLILAHRGSALPWLVDDRASLFLRRICSYPPDRALPGSPRQCSLPLACRHTSRRAPNWSSDEVHTWEHHPQPTIPPPRFKRQAEGRNREGGQLAASLEGEPSPTPAGKTLPHSYPETRFRR